MPRKVSRNFKFPALPPLPRFSRKSYIPVLVVLLIIASFLIGVLITKVQYLEGGTSTTVQTGQEGQPADSGAQAPTGPVDVSVGHLPVQGDKDAKVTVIEFADFQCPFCKQWFEEVGPNLIKDYVDTGKVKFAYRHYAFLGQESTDAALASECANEQEKFWEYHDYLFNNQKGENQGAFSVENLKQFAATLGLNTGQFNTCMDSKKYADNVTKDQEEGTKAGVNGTPATFVNGLLISGAAPYSTFKETIEQELNK